MSVISSSSCTARRCVIFGFPSYSHTSPLLLLSDALVQAGYAVTFYNVANYKERVESSGATFIDYKSHTAIESLRPMECNVLDLDDLHKEVINIHNEVWPDLLNIQNEVDLVIYDQFAIWGKRFAEKNHIPCLCSSTYLLTTPQYWESNFSAARLKNDKSAMEEFHSCLSGTSADGVIVYTPNEMQIMPSAAEGRNVFYLANRFAISQPASLASLDENVVIYVSFGTVFNCNLNLLRFLIDYFDDRNYEIIVSAGNNSKIYDELKNSYHQKNVQVHDFVDQLVVLQKSSLFINHGGINSLYEGICLEVPMIIFPQMEEQHINARKIEELGAAYYFKSANPSRQAMDEAVIGIKQNWKTYKQNISRLREAIRKSATAQDVAKQIDTLLSNRHGE